MSLIAWANDAGVKVYDTANDQRVTFIERPRGSPHPELLLPHLVWQVVMLPLLLSIYNYRNSLIFLFFMAIGSVDTLCLLFVSYLLTSCFLLLNLAEFRMIHF